MSKANRAWANTSQDINWKYAAQSQLHSPIFSDKKKGNLQDLLQIILQSKYPLNAMNKSKYTSKTQPWLQETARRGHKI